MRSVATRTIRLEVERLPAISAESIPRTGGKWRSPSESCVYRRSAYRVIMVPDGRDRAQNGPRTVGEGGRADVGPAAVAAHCPPVDLHDGSAARAGRPAGGGGGGGGGWGAPARGRGADAPIRQPGGGRRRGRRGRGRRRPLQLARRPAIRTRWRPE